MKPSKLSQADPVAASVFDHLNLTEEAAFSWLDLSGCLYEAIRTEIIQQPIEKEGKWMIEIEICPEHLAHKIQGLCPMC